MGLRRCTVDVVRLCPSMGYAPSAPCPQAMGKEQELEFLKAQADAVKAQLDAIEARVRELEEK